MAMFKAELVKKSVICIVALSLSALGKAAPISYLSTSQTGAQTQIDLFHTSAWLMTATIGFEFGGGRFVMKDGSNTTAPISFSLYQGTDTSGLLLHSITLSHMEFCAQVSNCGQFSVHEFLFPSPLPLVSGTTYFATLTSTASDAQSLAYFIKSDSFISDENGVPVNPQPVDFGPPANAVPEAATSEMLAVGLLLLIVGRGVGKLGNFQIPMRPPQRKA